MGEEALVNFIVASQMQMKQLQEQMHDLQQQLNVVIADRIKACDELRAINAGALVTLQNRLAVDTDRGSAAA